MIRLGFRMHCTALNIRQSVSEHQYSDDRRQSLLEIADMLEEADKLLSWSAEKCDILSHLAITYKKEGDISRKHIENLIT